MTVRSQSPDWDAGQYARFADHRLQPALDLINRVPHRPYAQIVDLGCGNGRVTPLLKARWPEATVTGVDNSDDMLKAARAESSEIVWQKADIEAWQPVGEQLIFSNAAFHWLDDHEALLARLLAGLPEGGVLAFQVPDNFDQESHQIMRAVASSGDWTEQLHDIADRRAVAEPSAYLTWLSAHASHVDLWQTIYQQRLSGDDPVFEWLKGAGMRPYLDRLDADDRFRFQAMCCERLAAAYPRQSDGTTLFPFRRLFAVAVR